MTNLTLYGLKNCDTCKKAIKAITATGSELCFVDIRVNADLSKKVPVWIAALGADALLNKRSTTWRTLSEGEKAASLKGDVAAVLIANPTLIKRPVIECADAAFVGWSPAVLEALTSLPSRP